MKRDQSYELIFWHQGAMMAQSSRSIYESLLAQNPVKGLSELPIESIVSRVVTSFPAAIRDGDREPETVEWRSDNGEDSFTMTWSPHHVRVECRQLALEHVTNLVDIAASFSCPLYDPQSGRRFRLTEP
jgi:hypothetical protein